MRVLLEKAGNFDKNHQITVENDFIFIPIVGNLTKEEIHQIKNLNAEFEVVHKALNKIERKPQTYSEYIRKYYDIEEKNLELFPKSFDIIGKIAIIEIPEVIEELETIIGKAIYKTYKNIRTVYSRVGQVSGKFRTRELKIIGGTDNPITIHRENNCLFKLNVKKVYYSPRLGSERWRVVESVRNGERIIDMFAGIGPYSIQIAKNKETQIIAFDINPTAIKYFKANLKLNKISSIRPILGDSSSYIDEYEFFADRIIMNLPGSASKYLKSACHFISKDGGIIHYYQFVRHEKEIRNVIDNISTKIQSYDRNLKEVIFKKKIKEISSSKSQLALDLVLS
ncbi:MAG: methyltransferase domain-containing protein [Candidatus Lokiarchaeota archaeon]|nr:methyltransferase domain-containing protein [Candidatus Lokiarchaeota archaeon]